MPPLASKSNFPIFNRRLNGHRLTYLDSASTSQKPKSVIGAIVNFYEHTNANIHRGIYPLSQEATEQYEETREAVRKFINARETAEIIFTKNTTESINLVAATWGRKNIKKGDIVLVSALEHHSNLVPWQILCAETGAELKVIPLNNDFAVDLESAEKLLTKKVKLLAITHASNVTGAITPIEKLTKKARKIGAKILLDGAQSAPHMKIDVQKLDCDFFAFSSHKMLGPTGVGVLYGKKELLETMPPFLFGGDMIKEVHQYEATWNDLPWKFEAGTPNIADVIAFKKALEYLENIGMEKVLQHDQMLLEYAKKRFQELPEIEIYSPKNTKECTGVLSFNVKGVHPHDTADIVSQEGICIRSGHHCCEPLMKTLNLDATARMSFYIYNGIADIDRAVKALKKVKKVFALHPTSYILTPNS